MLHWLTSRGISEALAIGIIALGVIQITLQIWALVDLIRRPAPAQRKVVFGAVIVVAGLIGALAYLAVGRPMLEADADIANARIGDEASRKRALDQLYDPDKHA
ncbi:MAG TPA: PLD nuclease N-terminal domain-containing protein [Gemmatimonadaceae bacterium]